MMPMAPDAALRPLIQPGFLIALRCHHQIVDLILVAIFPEQLDQRWNFSRSSSGAAFFTKSALQITPVHDMPDAVLSPLSAMNALSEATSFGLFFHGNSQVSPAAKRQVVATVHGRENLLPELGQIVVDDSGRYQSGVDHLEQVVVLQPSGGSHDLHRRLARRLQPLVECWRLA